MGWFFSGKSEVPSTVGSESAKEAELLAELPHDLAMFYTSATHSQGFKFPVTKPEPGYERPSVSEAAAVVCADFQSEFIECITHGSWKEKFTGCDKQMKKLEKCMEFQKEVLPHLGVKHVGNKVKEEEVLNAADYIGLRFLQGHKEKLSPEVLDEINVERAKIWYEA